MTEPMKPLALATILPGVPDWTMAVFPASEVPIGTELFTHSKNSRLQLQVEVANDNAQHWKGNLQEQQKENKDLRNQLSLVNRMIRGMVAGDNNQEELLFMMKAYLSQQDKQAAAPEVFRGVNVPPNT